MYLVIIDKVAGLTVQLTTVNEVADRVVNEGFSNARENMEKAEALMKGYPLNRVLQLIFNVYLITYYVSDRIRPIQW